jgi:hypothetical protein
VIRHVHLRSMTVALAAIVAACGGGASSSPTGGTPSLPQATRTVIVADASFSLPPGTATYKNIDLPPNGTLDAVVDWAGNSDINVYVTDNVCPGFQELRAGACPVIVKADSPTSRPERVSWSTATAAGRIWTVWIHNNGGSAESGTMEVGITGTEIVTGMPSPSPPPPTAPAGNPTANLAPGPVVRYTIKVRSIDVAGGGGQSFRDPYQDDQGRWVVHPDEFVVFDSTQKNGNGELCRVQDYPPRWRIDEQVPNVLVPREGQNNPFLLRVDIRKKGAARVSASVDGVDSNVLEIVSVGR